MAWIAIVPPSARHPHERYQVRYQDGPRQRSAGIFPTLRRAEAERRVIERAGRDPLSVPTEPDPAKARTLVGEYVTSRWWPAWKDQHPASEYGTRKKVEKRILPTFGDIPLGELDPSTIGKWKAAMVAEGLTARTVNTYLSLLGTILNAAVDDDYLARSPLVRKSGAGRTAATRNQPVPRREVWLLRDQLDRLVEAINPPPNRPRAGEGHRRPRPASESSPWTRRRFRRSSPTGSWSEEAPDDRIFTSPGSRGPTGTLAHSNFARVWRRALAKADLAHLWSEHGGFHFQSAHTYATWLIARRIPMIAIAGRFGARECGRDHDGLRPRRQAGRPGAPHRRRAGTDRASASAGGRVGGSDGLRGLPKVLHVTAGGHDRLGGDWSRGRADLSDAWFSIDGTPCMTEQPTVHQRAASTRPSRTIWAAYTGCALALLSAIPSFYWAAGGTIGLGTVGGTIEELARARDPSGVALGIGAGVLKVAGGVLALTLVRPWGRRVPPRLLGGVAWAASVVLTLYGGLLVAVGALVLAGVIRPAGPVDRTALWWHVLLWDLWFLVWGLLLGVAAWHYGRQSRDRGAR